MLKRVFKYLYLKYKWRGTCKFSFSVNFSKDSTFEKMTQIHHNTTFHGHLGFGSYIGNNCFLSAHVGRFTSIAPCVRCNCGIHPYTEPYVSTSPCFFSLNPQKKQCGSSFAQKQMFKESRYFDEKNKIGIKIGSDCWIGEGAFLVGGINIADGAVVLAHSVVTKNVPPYAIVGGVPAKIIRYRYDEKTIQILMNAQWWNKPIEWIKDNWILFSDLEKFKEAISK